MLIKKKSIVVAFTSGSIIAAVMVLTLIGYAFYTKLNADGFKRHYDEMFKKLQMKGVSR